MSVQSIGEPVRRRKISACCAARALRRRFSPAARGARLRVALAACAGADRCDRHRRCGGDAGRAGGVDRRELRERGLGTLRPMIPRRKQDGSSAFVAPQPLLAQGQVRYVGDPVAFVVAENVNQAKDAAERIVVEYEELPPVTTAPAALAADAPAVWDDNPGNEAFFHAVGDKAAGRCGIRPRRACRPRPVHNQPHHRQLNGAARLPGAIRPEDGRYTIRCTIQSVHQIRSALADHIFKVPQHQVRVVCDNMGGGFGMKGGCYPEYGLSLWASELIGRPVRWISERSEGLLTTSRRAAASSTPSWRSTRTGGSWPCTRAGNRRSRLLLE